MEKQRDNSYYYLPIKTNLIYERHYPSFDGLYVCVVCKLVDCRNTRVYNTQVNTEIKRKLKHQDSQGYYW